MSSKPTMLIIEDHQSIRDFLISLFTNHGYLVESANDGTVGFNKAKLGGYAVIILDLKMPHKDGLSFLKDLKAKPAIQPNGPIIIFSSADYNYARSESLKLGAAAYINKDEYDSKQLVDKVQQIIKSYQKSS